METPTEKQIQDTSNAAAMYAMEVKRIREQLTDLIEAHAKLRAHAEDAMELLDHAHSGFIPGCDEDEKWDKRKEEVIAAHRADFQREEQK